MSNMADTSQTQLKDWCIKGLVSAPCTPFTENGNVNLEPIDCYVQHIADFGIAGVFVTGTTGEGNSLTTAERKLVAEAWVKHGKGRLSPIIVQIGAGNIRDSQELARHAQEIGADAISCVCPTYHKPETLDSYVTYMQQVAAEAPKLPFLLYDIDFVTGVYFSDDEFFKAARPRIPTLRGLKHTTASFPSMNSLLVNHPEYQVMLGHDDLYLQALSIGIDYTICNSYMGPVLGRLKRAFDAGDMKTARIEQNRALQICNVRRKYNLSLPGGTKTFLKVLGLDLGQPRLPLATVPDSTVQALKKDLTDIGYFEWGVPK